MADILGKLAELATGAVETFGYPGVFALMALEDVFPPIPSELVLPLAGFLVGQGRMGFLPVLAASTAGSVAGAVVVYAVGRKVGEDRIRRFVRRSGRYLLVDEDDLDRAGGWFDRHGDAAVLFGRLVPGVRSVIALPAGVRGMPLGRFIVLSTVGAAAWNAVLTLAGWLLGSNWHVVSQYADVVTYAVLAFAAIGVAWFVVRRLRRRRAAGIGT